MHLQRWDRGMEASRQGKGGVTGLAQDSQVPWLASGKPSATGQSIMPPTHAPTTVTLGGTAGCAPTAAGCAPSHRVLCSLASHALVPTVNGCLSHLHYLLPLSEPLRWQVSKTAVQMPALADAYANPNPFFAQPLVGVPGPTSG